MRTFDVGATLIDTVWYRNLKIQLVDCLKEHTAFIKVSFYGTAKYINSFSFDNDDELVTVKFGM
jgi:hypothetical protein